MSTIHLTDGKRLRFPGRTDEFAQGVEIGMLAILMNMPMPEFSRRLSEPNLDQVRALADKMGYQLRETPLEEGWAEVHFRLKPARPKAGARSGAPMLRLVSNNAA